MPHTEHRERRRTTLVQKLAVGLDVSMIMTLLGLVFWLGQQSNKWDKAAISSDAQAATLEQVQSTVSQVQGQVLQMATSNNLGEAEARISVLETRAGNTEQLVRDLRNDMIERLRRIENKVDHIKDVP